MELWVESVNREDCGGLVYSRILGHIRTDGIDITTSHDSVYSQRAPVSLPLAYSKGCDLPFGVIIRHVGLRFSFGNKR